MAYAAGSGTSGEDLLVACHLTVCPPCREAVDAAEAMGVAFLDRAAAVDPSPASLDAVLALLDAPVPEPEEPAPAPADTRCATFPSPLRRLIGPLESAPWRAVIGGVRVARVTHDAGQRVYVMDFPPGFRIPRHGHHGVERALVLRGSFTDERASFGAGDVSWRDDHGHDVRIDDEGRCTTLFVNDGPSDFGLVTPIVDWWVLR